MSIFGKVEVLRVGTFLDGAGVEHTFSESDLAAIASSYNPAHHEAPVVVGHPADNAPAYGWVKRAFTEGKSLFLELRDVIPELVDACKRGLFKKRSIALYPDRTIRHIGFLGAMPPAIKGLKDIQFSDKNQICIDIGFNEFTERTAMDLAQALARIAQLNQEISTLQGKNADFSEQIKTLSAEKTRLETEFSEKNKQSATLITELTTQVGSFKTQISNQEKKAREKDFAQFCEKLVNEGRLPPKNKEAVEAQLEIAFQASTGTFAEGQVKPIDSFRKMLAESPKVIEFGETTGTPGKTLQGTAGEKLEQLAKKKMAENKGMIFSEATSAVQLENIDLADEYAEEVRSGR
jgi:hypothetical protein